MNRREFNKSIVLSALYAWVAAGSTVSAHVSKATAEPKQAHSENNHDVVMQQYEAFSQGPELQIGMVVYPGMFLQDLVGPLTVFEALMNRKIHLLWKDKQPVTSPDPANPTLIPVTPTTTFAQCPQNLDVLFVPGGVPGTLTMMEDPELISFLKEQGKSARFITSVCTGSLVLGAAGLLDGYRATSHWLMHDTLRDLGATPTHERVVVDRNRITGGGVTAGIDFALSLVALLRNELYAQAVQLYLEYDPQPPFDAGSPEKAPELATNFLKDMFAGINVTAHETAQRAWKRLPKV